jgi:integrase
MPPSMCDVIRLGRQHVRKGTISLSRQKTGVPFYVKVNEELAAAIDAMPRSNSLTFLINHTTLTPFTPDAFAKWFRNACNAAGLSRKDPETGKPRCTSHGLRKFAASRLASRAGTTTELKAMFGGRRRAKPISTPRRLIVSERRRTRRRNSQATKSEPH